MKLENEEQARSVVLKALTQIAPDAPVDELLGDDDLFDVLEIDSMDLLNVTVAIHDLTGIDIPERDYPKLGTLDEFSRYLIGAGSGAGS